MTLYEKVTPCAKVSLSKSEPLCILDPLCKIVFVHIRLVLPKNIVLCNVSFPKKQFTK